MDSESETGEPIMGTNKGHVKNAFSNLIAARIELASIEAREAGAFVGKKAVLGIILGITAFFSGHFCWQALRDY